MLSDPEARSDLSDVPLDALSVAEFFSTGGSGAEVRFIGEDDDDSGGDGGETEEFPLQWP